MGWGSRKFDDENENENDDSRRKFFKMSQSYSSRSCKVDKKDDQYLICKTIISRTNPKTGKLEKSERMERIKNESFGEKPMNLDKNILFDIFNSFNRMNKEFQPFMSQNNFGNYIEEFDRDIQDRFEQNKNHPQQEPVFNRKRQDLEPKQNEKGFSFGNGFKDDEIYDF